MSHEQDLPPGWVWTSLGDIVFPGGIRNPKMDDTGDFLYVDIEAVDNVTQRIVAPKQIPNADAPSRARMAIQTGDIIFSLVRPYLKNIAIVPPTLNGQVASTAYCVMRPEKGIFSSFVFYAVLRESFIAAIKTYGDSPPAGRDEEFLSMEIPIAPSQEQQRIVEAIEQQLTLLDASIATLRDDRIKLKNARASVLKYAVEGKLSEEWRAEHPAEESAQELLARILQERRARWEAEQLAKMQARGVTPKDDGWKKAYKEPVQPDTADLGELPEGWCWASVEQVTSRSEYGTSVKCNYGAQGVPVLRIPNIAAGEINLNDLKNSEMHLEIDENSSLHKGDLLVCRTNGSINLIGKTALVRFPLIPYHTFASYLLRFRLFETTILPKWLHLFMSSSSGRHFIESNAASSAGQHNISLTLMHTMTFPLPPLAEQQQIISEVEMRLSLIEQAEKTIEESLLRAERVRQSILRQAFAGKLVAQDVDDEPADVLLERIREAREQRAEEELARRKEERMQRAGRAKGKKKITTQAGEQEISLVPVLVEAQQPLEPEVVYKRTELKPDEVSHVEVFFEVLGEEEDAGYIRELRAKRVAETPPVLLEATPPAYALVAAQEAQDDSATEIEREE